MSKRSIHDFGVVDGKGDFYEFRWSDDAVGECRLDGVIQTERGPRRTELAVLAAHVWTLVCERTIRELSAGMGETERTKKPPTLKIGINRLSPLIGRELAVLLWTLMEVADGGNIEAILHGWRELAREERWWLYAKGAAPGQRTGAGWRLALFHALSETTDSRSAEPVTHEKKKPGSGSRSSKKSVSKKKPESRKSSNRTNPEQKTSNTKRLPKLIPPTTAHSKKQPVSPPTSDLTKSEKKSQPEEKVKKPGRTATTNN
jgi:hypothetical protein